MAKSIVAVFVRSPYNYDMNVAGEESGLKCEDVSLTVQSERDETDINLIVARFLKTGQAPADFRTPSFGDFSGVSDFHSAMNVVRTAEESFMTLDARLRARFGNDPQQLLEFLADKANVAEAIKLGLVPAPPEVAEEPPPQRVVVVEDPSTGGPSGKRPVLP